MRKNTDQKNSKFGYFSCRETIFLTVFLRQRKKIFKNTVKLQFRFISTFPNFHVTLLACSFSHSHLLLISYSFSLYTLLYFSWVRFYAPNRFELLLINLFAFCLCNSPETRDFWH